MTKVRVELKWFHQFQFAGIYAAKEKGYYQNLGLDVEIIERDPHSSPLKDVLSGKVDFGISDSTIIRDYLQGAPVVVLAAIFQHSPLVLISLKDKNIISPLELKNKRVMYQKDVDEAIIQAMFNEFDLTKDDFIFVPHNFKDTAILEDKADAMSAYVTNQPYWYQERKIPINMIQPSTYGIDFYGDLIFTSDEYFKNNTQVALNFRQATLMGWAYALEYPEEIARLIKNKYKAEKSLNALLFEAKATKKMVAADVIDLGKINVNRLKRIERVYKKQLEQDVDIDIEEMLYTHYLKPFDFQFLLYGLVIVSVLGLLIIVSLFMFNRQLSKRVSQQHSKLIHSNEKNEKLIDILDNNVMTLYLYASGKIVKPSKDLANRLGFSISQLSKKNFFNLIEPNHKKMITALRNALKNNESYKGELTILTADKSPLFVAIKCIFMEVNKNKSLFMLVFRDLTTQKKIMTASETDSLTQIPNRYKAEKIFEQEIYRANRYDIPLTLAIIDIDFFKKINDTYGHSTGDSVLIELSSIFKKNIRKSDFLARWGGEEFIVLMPNTSYEQAFKVCEKIRRLVAKHHFAFVNNALSISIGLSELKAEKEAKKIFDKADKALYEAKSHGRNQVIINTD